ncbi:hypothetical protein [Salipiger abyssi]|uniref:Uncharacterized protein n=1 Tax=Salipiger abyssi TaxID=1250539 RepID=A0A1P8UZ50_9RHOB|nr:hypothetical protein [Salipiger abyssi]APZ54668.1 hypothetical protein Ga0080574_TMP4334 [Salipiger abyssi]
MDWSKVTRNWEAASDRLLKRFPHLSAAALRRPPARIELLARQVAERHELTLYEARDEVELLLFADIPSYQLDRMAAG